MQIKELLIGITIAIVFCVVAVTLFSFEEKQKQQDNEQINDWQWFELEYAKVADYEDEKAVVTKINSHTKYDDILHQRITIFDTRPPSEFVFVQQNIADRQEIIKIRDELGTQTRKIGWDFSIKNNSELIQSDKPRVIFLPTGAWPKDFEYEKIENACTIYLGVAKNVSKTTDERIVEGGLPDFFANTKKISGYEYDFYGFDDEESIYAIFMTPFEIAQPEKFAQEIVKFTSDRCFSEHITTRQQFEGISHTTPIVKIKENQKETWARIEILDLQNNIIKIWDEKLLVYENKIEKVATTSPNQDMFRVYIWPQHNRSLEIKYYLNIYDSNYTQITRMMLADIKTQNEDNEKKEAFFTSVNLQNLSKRQMSILEVEDQYGRVYARAVDRTPKYTVSELENVGNQKRFLIQKDCTPIEQQHIPVKIADSQNWANVLVVDGKITVVSDWKEYNNTIEFEVDEQIVKYSWDGRAESAIEKLSKMILISLPIFVLIWLFVVTRKEQDYTIMIPEEKKQERKKKIVELDYIKNIISRPMHISEIVSKIQKSSSQKNQRVTQQSVLNVLEKLVDKKVLRKYREHYMVNDEKNTFEILRTDALMHQLEEKLFNCETKIQKRGKNWVLDNSKKIWRIHQKDIPIKQDTNYLVFSDDKELVNFEQEINNLNKRSNAKIKLAYKLKKIKFISLQND